MADPASDTFSLLSNNQDALFKDVFSDYTSHMSSASADFDTWFQATLRSHYPNHTLTVSPTPLVAYANIGYAKAELDTTESSVLRWRLYLAAVRRGLPGGLGDAEFFAKYNYTWMAEEFVLYAISMGYSTLYYILKEPNKEKGENTLSHCAMTDKLLLAVGDYASTLHHEILVYDGYWQTSRALWEQVQKSFWDDVILDDEMKKTLTTTVERFFDSRDVYKNLDVPWKRGLIFYGPAGNGKTISLKALMHSLSARENPIPTLYVKSMAYTWDIRAVFQKARQMSPCLLILEDIDTVIGLQNRSYFFNEVDGLEDNDGILMIATTNHLDRLDPGLSKRPSRFDRKYLFSLPNRNERMMYCEFWRKKLRSNKSIKFPKKLCAAIAGITYDFSFAYLKEAFVATLLVIAAKREDGYESDEDDGGDGDGLDDLMLWIEIQKQVKNLREDMESGNDDQNILAAVEGGQASSMKPDSLPGSWPGITLQMPDGGEGSVTERLERLKIQTLQGIEFGKQGLDMQRKRGL